MTVNELQTQLEQIPEERRDERIQIWIRGPLGGFIDISKLDYSDETISIDSTQLREIVTND